MRLVYFENDAGERINLNRIPGQTPTRGIIATNLTGLGYTPGGVYSKISAGYYRQTGEDEKMQPCGLTLNFTRNAYDTYKWLLDWMIDAGVWDYVYNPGDGEYRRRVTLEYINKPERNKVGHLVSQISLVTLTPWYREETLTGAGTVSVSAGGQIASAVKIVTTGTSLVNPYISMVANGEEFARCEISMNVSTSNSLEYSNFYDDSHIIGVINGVRTSLIENLTARHNIYGHRFGAYTVNLSDSNGATPAISVTVRKYWRTV